MAPTTPQSTQSTSPRMFTVDSPMTVATLPTSSLLLLNTQISLPYRLKRDMATPEKPNEPEMTTSDVTMNDDGGEKANVGKKRRKNQDKGVARVPKKKAKTGSSSAKANVEGAVSKPKGIAKRRSERLKKKTMTNANGSPKPRRGRSKI